MDPGKPPLVCSRNFIIALLPRTATRCCLGCGPSGMHFNFYYRAPDCEIRSAML